LKKKDEVVKKKDDKEEIYYEKLSKHFKNLTMGQFSLLKYNSVKNSSDYYEDKIIPVAYFFLYYKSAPKLSLFDKEDDKKVKKMLGDVIHKEDVDSVEDGKLAQKLRNVLQDIVFLTQNISEKYLVKKLIKEKGFCVQEFEKQLRSGEKSFLRACLQLLTPTGNNDNNDKGTEVIIYNTFLFEEDIPDVGHSVERSLRFFVTKYLTKTGTDTLCRQKNREDFTHFLFQEANRLGKLDEKLINIFPGSDFHYRLHSMFSRDPKFMLQKDGYIFKLLFLDKFISPRDFVEYHYLGSYENLGQQEFIQKFIRQFTQKSGNKKNKIQKEIIHNLVALGGQEIIEKMKLVFCKDINGKDEEKFQKLFENDLICYRGFFEEIVSNFILWTNLPRDICRIIINFSN
jgi:hypothetical protein